jgi:hypothetical protein
VAKISVLLTDDEEARFCSYCKEKGHKKSTLIARLIREHLDREGYASQTKLFESGRDVPQPQARSVKADKQK